MANTVVIVFLSTGHTGWKLKLSAEGSDTVLNNSPGGDTLTEIAPNQYTATVDEALSGTFEAGIVDGSGNGKGRFKVTLADDVGPYYCEEPSTAASAAAVEDISDRIPVELSEHGLMPSNVVDVNDWPQSNGDLNTKIDTAINESTLARKLIESDRYIDTDTTPWQVVWVEKGTGIPTLADGNELLRQDLFDVNGADLTAVTTPVGQTIGA